MPAHPSGRRRPWMVHAVTGAVVLLLGCVTAALAWSTVDGIIRLGMFPPGASQLWTVPTAWLVGTVLGAALLTARRARPLAVVVALTVLGILSIVLTGVLGILGVCLAIALYSVATERSAPVTWGTGAVVLCVLAFVSWNWQDIGVGEILLWGNMPLPADAEPARQLAEPEFSPGRRSASATLLLVLLLGAVAAGSAVRARRLDAQAGVDREAAAARDHEASAALGRASERGRIAREMHDIVAHSVSVMIALSDGAGAALDRAPDRSREALLELSRTGRAALADMQRVLGVFDPSDEDASGAERTTPTETDLRTIVDRYRAAGLPLTATGLDVVLPADTSVRLALVRIVSEALTNVLRHAPGTASVEVRVRRTASVVEVEVLDDGGTRPVVGGGTGRGVSGMRERAALLGGRVDVGPRHDGGWRVHVVLPCDGDLDERDDDGDGGDR
ncbi:histidine kinase [Sanguibacter sp. 25GB23B1]|uniref:histidine kinase n=1 Tax=unclassified Sanguibacter TaxID=2645534 RepID=UPI0032AF7DAB